eukprot:598469-Amphidinium_carterae.4
MAQTLLGLVHNSAPLGHQMMGARKYPTAQLKSPRLVVHCGAGGGLQLLHLLPFGCARWCSETLTLGATYPDLFGRGCSGCCQNLKLASMTRLARLFCHAGVGDAQSHLLYDRPADAVQRRQAEKIPTAQICPIVLPCAV